MEPRHEPASRGRSVASLLSCKASHRCFPTGGHLLRVLLLLSVAPHEMHRAEQRTVPTQLHIWLRGSCGSCSPTAEPALNHFHFQRRQRQNSSIMLPIRQTAAHSEFKFCQGGKYDHRSTRKSSIYAHTQAHMKDTYTRTHIITYICKFYMYIIDR